MTSADISRRIEDAAALFDAAGRADAPPGARVQCLLAAEHLRVAGANPPKVTAAAAHQVEDTIRSALGLLAALPPHVFAESDILNAASAARTALAQAERT